MCKGNALAERRDTSMKVNITGRQLNVFDEMKELIEKKLAKLDKFFPKGATANVVLSSRHGDKIMEITLQSGGTLFRSEVKADSFRNALDGAVSNIERQIRKNKTRLQKHLREQIVFPDAGFDDTAEEEEEILRTKTFSIRPMSPEDAILEMNLLGHDFFLFVNSETGKTCAVYRRKGGGYGLLEPEK